VKRLAYDRQGKMHMVKAKLPELQLEAESEGPAHMAASVSCQALGRGAGRPCVKGKDTYPISEPELPLIHDGKERKEHLNASRLHLNGNMGLSGLVS